MTNLQQLALRIAMGVGGLVAFLAGFSVFGAGFDFIDAHRNWPFFLMVPALVAAVIPVAALIFGGIGLIVASLSDRQPKDTPHG